MSAKPSRYTFGEFELDVAEWRLLRSGELVHLEPTVLKLLVYLIENRDRLVGKEELLDKVWEDSFISESALTKAVARLRKALRDDPVRAKYVETVHGLGYRFICPVSPPGARPQNGGDTDSPIRWSRAISVRVALIAVSITIAAVLGIRLGALQLIFEDQAVQPIRSLAVLPLDNLAEDPQQDYFVAGLQEALITELSRIPGVRIISRQSTLRYRNSDKSAPEIARELNVDGLVEGGVLRVENRVRITAQLIRGEADDHVWAETYERDVREVLVALNEVAEAIADEIEIVLIPLEKPSLVPASPVALEVQEAYLRGLYSWNRLSGEGAREALPHFQRAIQLDSEFAPAYARLAVAYLSISFFGDTPPGEFLGPAETAALQAIQLDSELSDAYTALGAVKMSRWDWPGAEEAFNRALELNPNDALARHGLGDYLTVMGRLEEGLEQVRRGYELDPFAPASSLPVAGHLYFMGRFDEAISFAGPLLELEPEHPVRSILSDVYWHKGKREESLTELRRVLSHHGASGLVEVLEEGHAASGPEGAHRALATRLSELSKVQPVNSLRVATAYSLAGEVDLAFEWLEKAFKEGWPQLVLIGVEPNFDALRPDPRFASLLSRMGLPSRPRSSTSQAPDDLPKTGP